MKCKRVASQLGLHSLNKKRQQLQWSALLLSLVLLSAQTIAQQHIHAAETPADTCVVCVQGDSPAVAASMAAGTLEQPVVGPQKAADIKPACQSLPVAYLTRGPPQA